LDVQGLQSLLARETFRNQALEDLCNGGEVTCANDLQVYLLTTESMFSGAQEALDKSQAFCIHAPNVTALAELFVQAGDPLDTEMTADAILGLLGTVPLAPITAIRAQLSGTMRQKFTFQSFAQHVYGTPTICGWWPSYMEETAVLWRSQGEIQGLPGLEALCALFERGARGGTTVDTDALLEVVLPAAGWPVEGPAVEEAFAEIRGTGPMALLQMARWMAALGTALAKQAAEEAQAAAA
jgi:hypothetical protein